MSLRCCDTDAASRGRSGHERMLRGAGGNTRLDTSPGARFVAVSPTTHTRDSNCYMRHRWVRLGYIHARMCTRWREGEGEEEEGEGRKKTIQAYGPVTVAVSRARVSGSNVVTRKCCVDVNSAATLSYPRSVGGQGGEGGGGGGVGVKIGNCSNYLTT